MKSHIFAVQDIERDELTGLYTRNAFIQYASAAFTDNPEVDYVLLISDIVGFKHILTLYGEREADELVKADSRLVNSIMPADSIIGRYGADQIMCFMPVMDDNYELHPERQRYSTITTPSGIKASVKIGACKCIDRTVSLKMYIEYALAALESIKHKYGQHFAFMNDELLEKLRRRALVEQNMEDALHQGQFQVYYQPKHDVITQKLVGAEALVRWVHPELGFLPPSDFIPVFEQTGFISELDDYVWRKTCQNLRKWIDQGLLVVPISINFSRIELARGDKFFDRRIQASKENNVPAELLHIEVTESMFGGQLNDMASVLKQCKAFGFGIELDDFGAGYSSLHTIADLPLDTVKLDMSLVRNISDPKTFRVISACVNMIRNMELEIVAEGVEYESQHNRLQELEVDSIQGYYYSKPLPEEDFVEYIRNNKVFSLEEKKRRAAIRRLMDIPMIDWDSRKYLISHLMTALLNLWGSLYIIDIRTGKSEELLGDKYFKDNVTESDQSEEIAKTYIEKSLLPQYKEAYIQFYDFSTLEKRMADKKFLTLEFEDYNKGWMRSTIFPAGTDADGHLSHILLTAVCINDEKIQGRQHTSLFE